MALTPSKNQTAEEKKAAQDDVLMREIDDAVREDQYKEFANRYGKLVIGVVVGGLLAFAGYLWWSDRSAGEEAARSETLVAALDHLQAQNFDTAVSRLEPLASGSDADAAMFAKMLQGGIAQRQGKMEEAATIFAAIADDDGAPSEFRDLARIREVSVRYDAMKPADVVAKLKALAVPGNPYFASAGELVAMAYLDQGKRAEAGTLLGEIAKNEDVPESAKLRARQMAGQLGIDAIEDVDELLEGARADGEAPAGAQQ